MTGTPTTAGTSTFTVRATDSTIANGLKRRLPISQSRSPRLRPLRRSPLVVPGNGATAQPVLPTLSWTAALGATSYDVYLGTVNPPSIVASNLTGTTYVPSSALSTSTTYFWKVVAKNLGGSSPDSATWAFTTVLPPPPRVSLATPSTGATNQPLTPTLTWTAAAGATAYDVYLGTVNPPSLAASNVAGASYVPSCCPEHQHPHITGR